MESPPPSALVLAPSLPSAATAALPSGGPPCLEGAALPAPASALCTLLGPTSASSDDSWWQCPYCPENRPFIVGFHSSAARPDVRRSQLKRAHMDAMHPDVDFVPSTAVKVALAHVTVALSDRRGAQHRCSVCDRVGRPYDLRRTSCPGAPEALDAVRCGGHRGERVGEAAHPGPLRICAANVTSLAPHVDAVASAPCDVLLLSECKATSAGQRSLSAAFSKLGWQVLWGAPRPRPAPGTGRGLSAGVAIACRAGLRAQLLPLTGDAARFHQEGRLCKSCLAVGDGRALVVMYALYGYCGASPDASNAQARTSNERLLTAVLDDAASHGDACILIGGDFNVAPSASAVLSEALSSGAWHDPIATSAAVAGGLPLPTCHARGSASRLDYVLISSSLLRSVVDSRLLTP